MEKLATNEELKLDDSVKQNNRGETILGRLVGPVADFINPTRNGRKYDESLWEKVFSNPIVKEYFQSGGIPGELDHPADRLETCSEKIAIMMPEEPKKGDDGKLYAYFDILDTPNGRIAYTLAKYGYKLGISSRGGGDTFTNYDGEEQVNEDTYDFQGFDLVLLPAVKAARLKMVESLQNGQTFSQAINEALEKAKPDEKKVMEETLTNLNLLQEKNVAANNAGAPFMKDLQESIKRQNELETKITELQEKLSVCYAKELSYEENITKYKNAIRNLSEKANNANALQLKVDSLNEQLQMKEKEFDLQVNEKKSLLKEKCSINEKENKLKESLLLKESQISKNKAEIKNLNEDLKKSKAIIEKLNENIAEVKKDLSIKTTNYNNKLAQSNKLIEQYRTTAKNAVNKYIESKAIMLGVSQEEITNKLSANYSFKDIDNVCENLSEYKLLVGNLPFELREQGLNKVALKENKLTDPLSQASNDDLVDDELLRLAGI